jgi:hypothetical protein
MPASEEEIGKASCSSREANGKIGETSVAVSDTEPGYSA